MKPKSAELSEVAPADFYTIEEVARMLKLHRNTVVAIFENEPGVFVIGRPETLHRRKYRTFRIPNHVFERVVRKHSLR